MPATAKRSRRLLSKNASAVALTNSMSSAAISPVPTLMIGPKPKKRRFSSGRSIACGMEPGR
jgi:hypothetical protein